MSGWLTKTSPSESSSSARIASVMKIMRLSLDAASSSPPSSIMPDIPGIIDVILDNDPLHLMSYALLTSGKGRLTCSSCSIVVLSSPELRIYPAPTSSPSPFADQDLRAPYLACDVERGAARCAEKLKAHMCSIRPCISPMPSSFETNGWGAKRSRSFRCSPVPKKMMGVLVAATLSSSQSGSACIDKACWLTLKLRLRLWHGRRASSR